MNDGMQRATASYIGSECALCIRTAPTMIAATPNTSPAMPQNRICMERQERQNGELGHAKLALTVEAERAAPRSCSRTSPTPISRSEGGFRRSWEGASSSRCNAPSASSCSSRCTTRTQCKGCQRMRVKTRRQLPRARLEQALNGPEVQTGDLWQ